jgi:integrase
MGVVVRYLKEHPKTGELIYRRAIPAELRAFTDRTQVRRFLGAKSTESREASRRLTEAREEYEEVVRRAQHRAEAERRTSNGTLQPITPALLEFLVQASKVEALDDDEWARWQPKSPDRRKERAKRLQENVEEDLTEARAWRTDGDLEAIASAWTPHVLNVAEQRDIYLDPQDPHFPALCVGLNDAMIEAWEGVLSRLQGHKIPTPPEPTKPDASAARKVPAHSFETIAEAILTNERLNIGAATQQSTRTALRLFREAHGSPPPSGIDKAAVSEWLDLLAARPNRLPQEQRTLSLRSVVELYRNKDVERLSNKTISTHLAALSAVWNKAQREEGTIAEGLPNPFVRRGSLKIVRPETPTQLSTTEISAIFALPIFTAGERPTRGKGEASYWIPLLLLWTGARPEEVAQLMVQDVVRDPKGQWTLRFTNEGKHPHKGERSLKTEAARRTIPIPRPSWTLTSLPTSTISRRRERPHYSPSYAQRASGACSSPAGASGGAAI